MNTDEVVLEIQQVKYHLKDNADDPAAWLKLLDLYRSWHAAEPHDDGIIYDAIAELTRALERLPLAALYDGRAEFYRAAFMFDEAAADLRHALELEPRDAVRRERLAQIYEEDLGDARMGGQVRAEAPAWE